MRLFLAWRARRDAASLHVAWNARGQLGRPLEDDHRFAVLRRLLHDAELDSRDRLAGCLLLLYAQPLTRTPRSKRATSLTPTRARPETSITLARGAIVLPAPLGSVALALRDQRLGLTGDDGWLMANAGTHITAERLRERLKRYGITSRPGRHAALLALGPATRPDPRRAPRLPTGARRAMGPRRGRHLCRLRRASPAARP